VGVGESGPSLTPEGEGAGAGQAGRGHAKNHLLVVLCVVEFFWVLLPNKVKFVKFETKS